MATRCCLGRASGAALLLENAHYGAETLQRRNSLNEWGPVHSIMRWDTGMISKAKELEGRRTQHPIPLRCNLPEPNRRARAAGGKTHGVLRGQ